MHPCRAGPCLPHFVLPLPGAFAVHVSPVVVANTLLGEAVNMQELWSVSVYNDHALTLHWRELINLSYHVNKLKRWGTTPPGYTVSGSCSITSGRSKQAGDGGYSQPWLCNSSAVLPSITKQPFSSPAYLSTLLLPSCLLRCN